VPHPKGDKDQPKASPPEMYLSGVMERQEGPPMKKSRIAEDHIVWVLKEAVAGAPMVGVYRWLGASDCLA